MRMWKRTTVLALAGAMASMGLASCGSGTNDSTSGDGGAADTFDYVAVLSMSGPLAVYGSHAKAALDAGIDLVNESGGIDGREVKLSVIDDASDAPQAVANVEAYLADHDAPDAVYGGQASSVVLPLAPILTREKLFNVPNSITPDVADPKKFPYTFQQFVPLGAVTRALVDRIADEGHATVGYAAVDNESGRSAVKSFEQVAVTRNLKVVADYVPATAVDATAVLERIKGKNPDVLVLNAFGPSAAALLKSRADIGWKIPTIGEGTGFATVDLGSISEQSQWDGVQLQALNWAVSDSAMLDTPAFEKFYQRFTAAHKIEIGMGAIVPVYQALLTVKAAYEATDKNDTESVTKALEGLGERGIPASIKDLWIGPSGLGYSTDYHGNASWGPKDFSWVPAQDQVEGMLKENP